MIFGKIGIRLSNVSNPLTLFGEYSLDRIEEGFASERNPAGRKWPALNPEYAKRKKGPSILTESKDMRGSFSFKVSSSRTTVGGSSSIPYLQIHQRGGVAGFGAEIKPREHTGATKKDSGAMASILLQHIRG